MYILLKNKKFRIVILWRKHWKQDLMLRHWITTDPCERLCDIFLDVISITVITHITVLTQQQNVDR